MVSTKYLIYLAIVCTLVCTLTVYGSTVTINIIIPAPDYPVSSIHSMDFWQITPITVKADVYYDGEVKNVTLFYRYSADNSTWTDGDSYVDTDGSDGWQWYFDFPNGEGYYQFYTIAESVDGKVEVPESVHLWTYNKIASGFLPLHLSPFWNPAPTIFNMNGKLYVIVGAVNKDTNIGTFYGYEWNGTAWVENTTIVNGLPTFTSMPCPEVFYMDSKYFLISGTHQEFYGYEWNGTAWVENTTIVNGLPDIFSGVEDGYPTVYNMSNTFYLITGAYDGCFYGYEWNGTSWVENTTIVNGLPDVGFDSAPDVFKFGDKYYLITGTSYGTFFLFLWNGYRWTSCPMDGVDVGDISMPEVFIKDGLYYMISGCSNFFLDRNFEGFVLLGKPRLSIAVDLYSPQSQIDSIFVLHSGYANNMVTISATSTDTMSGVKNVTLFYRYSADNSTWTDGDSYVDTDGSDGWQWYFDFPNGEGYYQFYTIAYDNVGREENYTSIWIKTTSPDIEEDVYYVDPTVFFMDNTYYAIFGYYNSSDAGFIGYEWNGTSWVKNISIVNGLPSFDPSYVHPHHPKVFEMDDKYYLIYGEMELVNPTPDVYGYEWNGTSWVENNSIISGITPVQNFNPEVFIMNGTYYLIASDDDANFYGYEWNGTAWVENTTIVNGLPGGGAPTVFKMDSTYYLILGTLHYIYGFYWTGNMWVQDDDIVSGLTDLEGVSFEPADFIMNDTIELMIGWYNYTAPIDPKTYFLTVEAENSVTFDETPPVLNVDPIPYWKQTPQYINVSATDNFELEEISLYYRYSDDNETWSQWILHNETTSPPWSANWTFNFPDGTKFYQLRVTAIDKALNKQWITLKCAKPIPCYFSYEGEMINGSTLTFFDKTDISTHTKWIINEETVAEQTFPNGSHPPFNLIHTFNISNIYNVTLYVYNQTFDVENTYTVQLTIDKLIPLRKSQHGIGINYIAVPFNISISAKDFVTMIGLQEGEWLHMYNESTNTWQSLWVHNGQIIGDDFTLQPWQVVAVTISQQRNITINIDDIVQQTMSTSQYKTLEAGYHYLSWSNETGTDAKNMTSIGLETGEWVFKYDLYNETWLAYRIGYGGDDFMIKPYDCFVVYVNNTRNIIIGGV